MTLAGIVHAFFHLLESSCIVSYLCSSFVSRVWEIRAPFTSVCTGW